MARVGFKFKGAFFNTSKVLAATSKATRKVLSRFGAFVRQTAKRSMRQKRGESKPGQPPHSHEKLIKRFMFFGFDFNKSAVVIGPALLKNADQQPRGLEALEHGGTISRVRGRKNKRKRVKLKIKARPFMGPALEKETPKLPAMWRNSIV